MMRKLRMDVSPEYWKVRWPNDGEESIITPGNAYSTSLIIKNKGGNLFADTSGTKVESSIIDGSLVYNTTLNPIWDFFGVWHDNVALEDLGARVNLKEKVTTIPFPFAVIGMDFKVTSIDLTTRSVYFEDDFGSWVSAVSFNAIHTIVTPEIHEKYRHMGSIGNISVEDTGSPINPKFHITDTTVFTIMPNFTRTNVIVYDMRLDVDDKLYGSLSNRYSTYHISIESIPVHPTLALLWEKFGGAIKAITMREWDKPCLK
jgi:hypothetical protein